MSKMALMGLQGAMVSVSGAPAAAARLEAALRAAGARVLVDGPVDYVFHVSAPGGPLDEKGVVRLLERVDASGGRLFHVCVLRDPAAPLPVTLEEVRPLAVEDGLCYLAIRHAVPLAALETALDAPDESLAQAALRAAEQRLDGTFALDRRAP